MDDKKLYVHYGCGQCAPIEWKNFDASPTLQIQKIPVFGRLMNGRLGQVFDKNARYGDIIKGLPGIKENSVEAVYCSHVLEHLSLADFRKALANTYKMLKPGGTFRMVMPDLKVLVDDYITDKQNGDPEASIRFVKRTIMGLDTRPGTVSDKARQSFGYLSHLWLWDNESAIVEFEKAGFKNIRKMEFNDAEDPMFKLVENKKRFDLCIRLEAIK